MNKLLKEINAECNKLNSVWNYRSRLSAVSFLQLVRDEIENIVEDKENNYDCWKDIAVIALSAMDKTQSKADPGKMLEVDEEDYDQLHTGFGIFQVLQDHAEVRGVKAISSRSEYLFDNQLSVRRGDIVMIHGTEARVVSLKTIIKVL